MNQLVLHLTFVGGSTVDVSGHDNHARSTGATPAPPPDHGAYVFAPNRGMMVAASPVLSRLSAFRLRTRFCVTRHVPNARHNLLEGHAAFMLAVMPDYSLAVHLLGQDSRWHAVSTPAQSVVLNRWHTAEASFDGISRVEVAVDATRVGGSVPGPIRGIGPLGIGIGRWPDYPRYELHGMLGETKLWRYDPMTAFRDFVDPCCEPDAAVLAEVFDKVEATGMTRAALRALLRDQQDATLRLLREARSAGGTAELDSIVPQVAFAASKPARADLPRWRDRLRASLVARLGAPRMAAYDAEAAALLARVGLTAEDGHRMLAALCLGDLAPAGEPRSRWPEVAAYAEGGDAPWNDTAWVPDVAGDDG